MATFNKLRQVIVPVPAQDLPKVVEQPKPQQPKSNKTIVLPWIHQPQEIQTGDTMNYKKLNRALKYGADLAAVSQLLRDLASPKHRNTRLGIGDHTHRLVTADALQDNGREEEANILRSKLPIHIENSQIKHVIEKDKPLRWVHDSRVSPYYTLHKHEIIPFEGLHASAMAGLNDLHERQGQPHRKILGSWKTTVLPIQVRDPQQAGILQHVPIVDSIPQLSTGSRLDELHASTAKQPTLDEWNKIHDTMHKESNSENQ